MRGRASRKHSAGLRKALVIWMTSVAEATSTRPFAGTLFPNAAKLFKRAPLFRHLSQGVLQGALEDENLHLVLRVCAMR